MGFFDFIKRWFNSIENEPKTKPKPESKTETKEMNDNYDDKSFHPEILYLINKDDAEYVDFIEETNK